MAEKIKELRPVHAPRAYLDKIEKALRRLLRREIYEPLMREFDLPRDALENSLSAILYAIRRGTIRYAGGAFHGSFNSEISKELHNLGATWDKRTSTFKLPSTDIPPDLRAAIALADQVFAKRVERIEAQLKAKEVEEITRTLRLEPILDATLWKVDGDLVNTLKSISVPPALTAEQRRRIAEEWEQDLRRGIKDFAAEEILQLRQDIKASVLAGNRFESAVKAIQRSYGVSMRKAEFLAQQETKLMVAKYKEARYAESGVHEYKWRCVAGSPLHPVRPSHKVLDGKIFRYDNPPITTAPSEAPRRNNPGEDFRCRCQSVPLARFRKET